MRQLNGMEAKLTLYGDDHQQGKPRCVEGQCVSHSAHQLLHVGQGRLWRAGVVHHGCMIVREVRHLMRHSAELDAGQWRQRNQHNRQPARRRAWRKSLCSHPNYIDYPIAVFEI